MVDDASVAIGGPVSGVEGNRAVEVGERKFERSGLGMREAPVVVRVAVIGIQFYRRGGILRGGLEIAEAQVGYAEVVASTYSLLFE